MKISHYLPGQTPLDPNEVEGLIPGHINLMSELNEWEQNNIDSAVKKYVLGSRQFDVFDPLVLKEIHRDMFDRTWKWAGMFRQSNKNLGVDWTQIQEELKKTCDDFRFSHQNKTYPYDEIATRYHHRIVSIHLFPNGNGRHARLIADIYLNGMGLKKLSWGAVNFSEKSRQRKAYIDVLRLADGGDFAKLIEFARG